MDLGQFVVEQANQFVILLDGLERLYEDGLSTGTGTVDHSLDAAFLLYFDRNYEALAADGDQFVLYRATFGELSQMAAERFLDLTFLFFDFAANAAEFGRSAIIERSVGEDLVAEHSQKGAEVGDAVGKCSYGDPVTPHGGRGLADNFAPFGRRGRRREQCRVSRWFRARLR